MIHEEKLIITGYVSTYLFPIFYACAFSILMSINNSRSLIMCAIGFYKANAFSSTRKKIIKAKDCITELHLYSKLPQFKELQVLHKIFSCVQNSQDSAFKVFSYILKNTRTLYHKYATTKKGSGFFDTLYSYLIHQHKLSIYHNCPTISQYNKNTLVTTSILSIRGFSSRTRVRNTLNNKESSYE